MGRSKALRRWGEKVGYYTGIGFGIVGMVECLVNTPTEALDGN